MTGDASRLHHGLCSRCRWQRVIRNRKGSEFSFCRKSLADPAFPRYPVLPVLECPGFSPTSGETGAAQVVKEADRRNGQ